MDLCDAANISCASGTRESLAMLRLAIRDCPLGKVNGVRCLPFGSREVVAPRPLRTLEDTGLRELDYES